MSNHTEDHATRPLWLNAYAAARYLGVSLSELRVLSEEEGLPWHRAPGDKRHYLASELDAWFGVYESIHPIPPVRRYAAPVGQLAAQE
jgi:hypothetical protein